MKMNFKKIKKIITRTFQTKKEISIDVMFSFREMAKDAYVERYNFQEELNDKEEENYDFTLLLGLMYSSYINNSQYKMEKVLPVPIVFDADYSFYDINMGGKRLIFYKKSLSVSDEVMFTAEDYSCKCQSYRYAASNSPKIFKISPKDDNKKISKKNVLYDLDTFKDCFEKTPLFYIELNSVFCEKKIPIKEFVSKYKEYDEFLTIAFICMPQIIKEEMFVAMKENDIDVSVSKLNKLLNKITFGIKEIPEQYRDSNYLKIINQIKQDIKNEAPNFKVMHSLLFCDKLKENLPTKDVVQAKRVKI